MVILCSVLRENKVCITLFSYQIISVQIGKRLYSLKFDFFVYMYVAAKVCLER